MSVWRNVGNLKGPPGPPGLHTGDNEPTPRDDYVLWIDPSSDVEVPAPLGYETIPVGGVIAWSRHELPPGYVLADGATYSEQGWPQGYEVAEEEVAAGNPFWTVNAGARTFTVPDLSDRFLMSSTSRPLNERGGDETVALTVAQMPVHFHHVNDHFHGAPPNTISTVPNIVTWAPGAVGANVYGIGGTATSVHVGATGTNSGATQNARYHGDGTANTNSVGSGTAHNNMPPYVVLAFVVKLSGITITGKGFQGPSGPPGPPGQDGLDGQVQIYRVTSLPASPNNGDQVDYVADAANGVLWRLRYDAMTDWWEFVGGAPLTHEVLAGETTATVDTAVDLATIGPTVTVPLEGDYFWQAGAMFNNSSVGGGNLVAWEVQLYAMEAPTNRFLGYVAAFWVVQGAAATAMNNVGHASRRANGLAAGQEVRMRYRRGAWPVAFQYRTLALTPVRVR